MLQPNTIKCNQNQHLIRSSTTPVLFNKNLVGFLLVADISSYIADNIFNHKYF